MMERRASGQDSAMDVGEITSLDASAERAAPPATGARVATFREIFDDNHTFVFRSLLHLGVTDASADDAVQEVFVVVHRRLASYDPALPLRAWLWGIARNVAANHRRSVTRDRRLRDTLRSARSEAPDASLDRERELRFVRETLVAMEEPLRDVLALSDIEGMTAPEIAAAVGANVNTIYSRLRAARQRFADAVRRRDRTLGGRDGG